MKLSKKALRLAVVCSLWSCFTLPAMAKEQVIEDGIYIGELNVGGLTEQEAEGKLRAYIDSASSAIITIPVVDGIELEVSAEDLGFSWTNTSVVKEAMALGKTGNVISRFKQKKDLTKENQVFPIEYKISQNAVKTLVEDTSIEYNQVAQDSTLALIDGTFFVEDGISGCLIDEGKSVKNIYDTLQNNWDFKPVTISLDLEEDIPRGTSAELLQVKDVLGSFTTSYTTSSASRCGNVENACSLINGRTMYPGDEFSMLDTITPFTAANGYFLAGSYMNGKVVESMGGGICQVSTTLYNAVLKSELEVVERHNHSMIVGYVDPSADAAIAESAGTDFKFVNNTDHPIYIEGFTENKHITFNIYGVEYRDAGHEVVYKSEVLETMQPAPEQIILDGSFPVGYVSVQSAHIGYKARLWKITYENGVEVSREQINSSNYMPQPRMAVVGVATDNPDAYNQINAAAATGNIDYVRGVAAALTGAGEMPQAPPPPAPAPDEQQEQEQPYEEPEQPSEED